MRQLRVLVFGAQEGLAWHPVKTVLDELHAKEPVTWIFHGAGNNPDSMATLRGADWYAEMWAILNEVPYTGVPARIRTGRVKGTEERGIRNRHLLNICEIDLAIGFPGGRETHDMHKVCERRLMMRHWRVENDGSVVVLR